MAKKKKILPVSKKEETPLILNMTFEEAMKKALSTPIPKKAIPKKKAK